MSSIRYRLPYIKQPNNDAYLRRLCERPQHSDLMNIYRGNPPKQGKKLSTSERMPLINFKRGTAHKPKEYKMPGLTKNEIRNAVKILNNDDRVICKNIRSGVLSKASSEVINNLKNGSTLFKKLKNKKPGKTKYNKITKKKKKMKKVNKNNTANKNTKRQKKKGKK